MQILEFLSAIPELYKLFRVLQKAIDDVETEVAVKKKVKTDIKTIHEAFSEKDSAKLNSVFHSATK